MGMIGRFFKRRVENMGSVLSQVFSVKDHKKVLGGIKRMGLFLVNNRKDLDIKATVKLTGNHQAFLKAQEKHGAYEKQLKSLHKNYVIIAYLGVLYVFVSAILGTVVFHDDIFSQMLCVTFGLFSTVALWFRGALHAYQIKHRILDGIGEFLKTPMEYLPDPFIDVANSASRETQLILARYK